MSKPEWGVKRICQACSAKFYDFQRSPIVCPACGAEFDPEAFLKSRRGKPVKEKEAPKKAPPPPAAAKDEDETEDEELLASDEQDDGLVVDEDEDDSEELSEVAVDEDDKE